MFRLVTKGLWHSSQSLSSYLSLSFFDNLHYLSNRTNTTIKELIDIWNLYM